MSPIAQTLESLLGADAVCPTNALEAALHSQIAQALTPETQIDCAVFPNSVEQLAEAIACIHANRWRVLVCGSGSKLHWGGLTPAQVVISTARLNRLIDHAAGDMTVTAEAGLRFADLQAILKQQGQFLAADPAYASQATLGGIVATADTGALRQRYGGIREFLIGLSLVRADGKIAKAGGRVVKNVAGYDLMKLLTGSYGTLGVISQLTFRLYPLSTASRTVVLTGTSEAIAVAASSLLASGLTPTAAELVTSSLLFEAIDSPKGELSLIARFQSIEVSVEKQAAQLVELGQTLGLDSTDWADAAEDLLWQQLQEPIESRLPEPLITCKIGIVPAKAVEILALAHSQGAIGILHAGSGLGTLRFNTDRLTPQGLLELRDRCQQQGGFLSLLEAPIAWKQKLDVWGYSGNAINLMQTLKRQFDPENLFSPGRFVGGI
ncbi:FAD-binding oxidoreductase [Phormidium tenue FACHB-886]|nr:FAD-binding oxidoreductase [Phormidium tenue FACHB-886]